MTRLRSGRRSSAFARESWLVTCAAACFALTALGIVLARPDRVGPLSIVLGCGAVFAGVFVSGELGRLGVSAGFLVSLLAAVFLGPASACIAALITEVAAATAMRTRWRLVVLTNIPPTVLAALVPALIVQALYVRPVNDLGFYAAVAFAALVELLVNFGIFSAIRRIAMPESVQYGAKTLLHFAPSGLLSIAIALAGVGITLEIGNAGIAFALAAVLAFSYMVHLLRESRQRAEQYASLSWGVLGGLMRSLDIRDEATARHSAAVARFAQDIARAVGMDDGQCELAHTAGLLHDIGRFALSDRVAERGRTLTEEDWVAIQRHPELGADMLRDLGVYGPVAGIIIAHHERLDGRGYPKGLPAAEIPELAKIISVAEVYDTLTASDTYRTQMSSFEALNELRRVSGTQLEGRYVEVLAELLTGEGVEYRHADRADFDRELNMERRIRQAGTGR